MLHRVFWLAEEIVWRVAWGGL